MKVTPTTKSCQQSLKIAGLKDKTLSCLSWCSSSMLQTQLRLKICHTTLRTPGVTAAPQACAVSLEFLVSAPSLPFTSCWPQIYLLWILGSLGVEWEDWPQISLWDHPNSGLCFNNKHMTGCRGRPEHLCISAGDKTSSSNVPSDMRLIRQGQCE